MSAFDRHPRLRWAVPAVTATLLVGGAALGPTMVTADPGLPPRTAEELLVDLQQPAANAVSGTITTRADLGLPELPGGMAPGGELGLASGESTLRLWIADPERQRLALLDRAAETAVIRNGDQVWVWSSDTATADSYQLPDHRSAELPPAPDSALPGNLPSTPEQLATLALRAIDPSTQVTTAGVGRVAGRDVYELILTPRDPDTLVRQVTLAIDAETQLPLRVRVYSTQLTDPALEVGFTAVDYTTPDAALFDFTPPPGATVTEHPAPTHDGSAKADGATGPGVPEPTIVGEGWSTILVGDLPVDVLGDLAEPELATGAGDSGALLGGDGAGAALALLQALPEESGSWGTGRVLRGTLFSAILTDDARVAIGSVSPQALGAALATQ